MENNIVGEDMICPISNNHCDDECCTIGSECNISGDGLQTNCEPPKDIKKESAIILVDLYRRVSNVKINEIPDFYIERFKNFFITDVEEINFREYLKWLDSLAVRRF